MKKSMILILTILSLSGCFSDSEKLKTVTIEDRYSVSIPSYLIKCDDLNDAASLQYGNNWYSLFIIAIEEPQENWTRSVNNHKIRVGEAYSDDLKGYSDLSMIRFGKAVSARRKSERIDTLINNMPARTVSFLGKVNDLDLFYFLAFVEGKDKYYKIMTWTTADKEEKYKAVMNKMIYSFKEEL